MREIHQRAILVSLWRRALGAVIRVGILIAFLTVLISLLGPPIGIFITTRMEARRVPAVKIAAQALADYSVSNSPGTTLSYFGYEFEVPWNASFKQRGPEKVASCNFSLIRVRT